MHDALDVAGQSIETALETLHTEIQSHIDVPCEQRFVDLNLFASSLGQCANLEVKCVGQVECQLPVILIKGIGCRIHDRNGTRNRYFHGSVRTPLRKFEVAIKKVIAVRHYLARDCRQVSYRRPVAMYFAGQVFKINALEMTTVIVNIILASLFPIGRDVYTASDLIGDGILCGTIKQIARVRHRRQFLIAELPGRGIAVDLLTRFTPISGTDVVGFRECADAGRLDRHVREGKLLRMTRIKNVAAVFFDMDGTLVDSEIFTAQAVNTLCGELGIDDVDIDCSPFEGSSWELLGEEILRHYPSLAGTKDIPSRLHQIYHYLLINDPPAIIYKAREAVIAAHELMPTAIVSSSNRVSIEETMRRMELSAHINFYTGAEDCDKGKPAPDGYLKAAEFLQTDAGECLVFEDSIPGIQAARNAGMQVVAVTCGSHNVEQISSMADMAIKDYSELEDHFFERIGDL